MFTWQEQDEDEDIYITSRAEHTQLVMLYNDVLQHGHGVYKPKNKFNTVSASKNMPE